MSVADVIVCLSGGDVLEIAAPDDITVEVRQYHRDFKSGVGEIEDDEHVPGCTYEIADPLPANGDVVPRDASEIVTEIVDVLDGNEWDSSTLDSIADILVRAGHEINSPDETEWCSCPCPDGSGPECNGGERAGRRCALGAA